MKRRTIMKTRHLVVAVVFVAAASAGLGPCRHPKADFSADVVRGAVPLTVRFDDQSAACDAAITSWDWDFGDGSTASNPEPGVDHVYTLPGTFTVSLTVTDAQGHSDTIIKSHLIEVTEPAPAPGWTFGGPGNEGANAVLQTADGGYILAGYANSWGDETSSHSDSYILKLDASGNEAWSRIFGNGHDGVQTVEQTADGGYVFMGSTYSPETGAVNAYLLKLDASGAQEWFKTLDDDIGSVSAMRQTTDGGYILAGCTGATDDETGLTYQIMSLIKLDALAAVEWSQGFPVPPPSSTRASAVQQTADGGYFVAGQMQAYERPDSRMFAVKTDSAGNLEWSDTFGDYNYGETYAAQQTADGGYMLAGETGSFAGMDDDWSMMSLVKLDASGNEVWSREFGCGTGCGAAWTRTCWANAAQQTADGGYILAGAGQDWSPMGTRPCSAACLIKTDASGNLEWSKTIGGEPSGGYARAVQQTADGGYFVAGTWEFYCAGAWDRDMWVLKTDADGNPVS